MQRIRRMNCDKPCIFCGSVNDHDKDDPWQYVIRKRNKGRKEFFHQSCFDKYWRPNLVNKT